MAERLLVCIENKGLFLSQFDKDALYVDGKLDLRKFAQIECIAAPSFAAELVASTIDGTINSIIWKNKYSMFIKAEPFTTYRELQTFVRLRNNKEITPYIARYNQQISDEFARFYMTLYDFETKILDVMPELFFKPMFYNNSTYKDELDVYCQYDKYGLEAFAQALFYYSINKTAFDSLRINSSEFYDISILLNKLEELKNVVDPNFSNLISNSIVQFIETYSVYTFDKYKQKFKNNIKYLVDKNVWTQIVADERHALAAIRNHKDIIPQLLFQYLESWEDSYINYLTQSKGIATDSIKEEAQDPVIAGIQRVAKSKYMNKDWSKADWGAIFRLLVEQNMLADTGHKAVAGFINKACGKVVTSASSIRNSHALYDFGGKYVTGWTFKESPSRQAAGLLAKYNEMARIFMEG